MPVDHQSRRITGGENLLKAIASLSTVAPDERQKFLYDRLMSHVDDICAAHKNGHTPCFNSKQVEAIKDVAFQLMVSLNGQSAPVKIGFFAKLRSELSQMAPTTLIALSFGALVALTSFVGGLMPVFEKGAAVYHEFYPGKIEQKPDPKPPTFTFPEMKIPYTP